MADQRLREAERRLQGAPDDPQALAAVRRERGRAGRCPECVAPTITPSTLLLDDAATCWPCYFKVGLERLRLVVCARASELLGVPEEKVMWGACHPVKGRKVVLASVSAAVGRALKGWFPAMCHPASNANALSWEAPSTPVYRDGYPSSRALHPACVAHRLGKTIVVGYYMDFANVNDEELGRTWPILKKKQEMHGNAYVVAHGRPCYEKTLRQRMTAWAEASATHLDGPLADFRMVAPVTAWKAWKEERRLARQAKWRQEMAEIDPEAAAAAFGAGA